MSDPISGAPPSAPGASSADAFDVLRAPADQVQPSARFTAELRTRLVDALAERTSPTPPTQATRPQEPVMATVTPYLIVRNAAAVLDFYRDAFGAVIHERLVDDSGRIGHSELTIGTSRMQLADEFPEFAILGPESRGGGTCSFTLEVSDVDATFARAVELGATVRTSRPKASPAGAQSAATTRGPCSASASRPPRTRCEDPRVGTNRAHERVRAHTRSQRRRS